MKISFTEIYDKLHAIRIDMNMGHNAKALKELNELIKSMEYNKTGDACHSPPILTANDVCHPPDRDLPNLTANGLVKIYQGWKQKNEKET